MERACNVSVTSVRPTHPARRPSQPSQPAKQDTTYCTGDVLTFHFALGSHTRFWCACIRRPYRRGMRAHRDVERGLSKKCNVFRTVQSHKQERHKTIKHNKLYPTIRNMCTGRAAGAIDVSKDPDRRERAYREAHISETFSSPAPCALVPTANACATGALPQSAEAW